MGENYNFSVTPENPPEINSLHWKHSATNSAIEINQLEVDILNWRVAANSKESVTVKLVNPVWEFISWNDNKLVLPNVIKISDPVNYRGTPTIYIQVSPWRIIDNQIEVLTSGNISISVKPIDFPVNYSHPYLLNGDENELHRSFSNETEYLIIAPSHLASPALSLADMHTSEVNADYQLNTELVLVENIATNATGIDIREYIIQRIENDLLDGLLALRFLLLFGDENDIPPIFNNGDYPSDDFYTTADNNNIFSGNPQLASGRIPVSNENDAWTLVEKIKNYTLYPTSGIWRSKVALVADDMYRSCSFDNGESSHTVNSDAIYDSLNTLLPILPFYGVDYELHSGCAHPDLTGDLIRTINNGVALINYIGHGDPETWAGEKLISKSRDLSLIHPGDNKLAIWIAGTCSFGKYNGENSFMEALLFKEDGAIAMVATTDVVGYTENSNYLKNLFGLSPGSAGIQQFLKGENNLRIGELVMQAKNGNYYKFHTFGDPALRLPFPKVSNTIITGSPNPISLIQEQTVSVNNPEKHSTLLVRGYDKEFPFGTDSLFYTIPGDTYAQMNSDSSQICFRIPIDAGSCDDCATIHMYQDDEGFDGEIQFIADISILESVASSNDEDGPDINVSQNGSPIIEGSAIIPGLDLTISLDDSSGINLMETIGHGIRYAFDDDDLTLISGDEFIYETCSEGKVQIPV
ncbi:hypothetical protein HX837_08360, partial [Marine Group I thaumarchaeote]|nr:hypothetical protein [Marine Group I thaumarchaeote]